MLVYQRVNHLLRRPPAASTHLNRCRAYPTAAWAPASAFLWQGAGNDFGGNHIFSINWWDMSYNPWVLTINEWQFSCEYAVSKHEKIGVLRQHVPVFVGPSQMHFSSCFQYIHDQIRDLTDTIVPPFGDVPTISALCWALWGASEDARSHPRPLRFGFIGCTLW